MITSPRKDDGPLIDTKPTNSHSWLNRACALTRWAMNRDNNPSLTHMIKIQARLAIEKSHSGI